MGKLEGNKSNVNIFWLFIRLETNVILTMVVNCGLKVIFWEAFRPDAGGIGTKTNSAPNCSWVGVGVWAELGNDDIEQSILILFHIAKLSLKLQLPQ